MTPGRQLRRLLDRPEILVAPGAYDAITARLVAANGFEAVYMTGAGTVNAHLGLPDIALGTLTEFVENARVLDDLVNLRVGDPVGPVDTTVGRGVEATVLLAAACAAAVSAADWRPAVDIVEEKARFVLRADLPGVDREAIDVSMEDGFLTITGERATEDRTEVDGIERYERVSGRFYRRFSLPETADADGITARMQNGILTIEIPKLPEVQPRRIDIEAA